MEYQILSNVEKKMSLFIDDEMTVGEVRTIVGLMLGVPEDIDVVMTYNGMQLKVDEECWADVTRRSQSHGRPKLYCTVTGKPKLDSTSSEAIRAVIPGREQSLEEERRERARARAMEPMIDAMSKNPEMMSAMFSANPELKKMVDANPEMARQLKDPETLKFLMMSQLDPDRRKEMSRNTELALAQISNYPGGQQMLDRYLTGALRDMENATERTEADLHMTAEELARPDPTKECNSSALPNPWAQQQQQQERQRQQQRQRQRQQQLQQQMRALPFGAGMMSGLPDIVSMFSENHYPGPVVSERQRRQQLLLQRVNGRSDGLSRSSIEHMRHWIESMRAGPASSDQQPQAAATVSPSLLPTVAASANAGNASALASQQQRSADTERKDFTSQLAVLRDMGFENEALCHEALEACNGDVEAAVDYLSEKME